MIQHDYPCCIMTLRHPQLKTASTVSDSCMTNLKSKIFNVDMIVYYKLDKTEKVG